MIPIREKREMLLYNRIPVLLQDNPNYNVEELLRIIKNKIPQELVSGLDYVLIGGSSYMEDRDVDSVYKDGIIYMSNEMQDLEEAALSMIHEIAHLVEETHPDIYMDQTIETEFLGKRKKLEQIRYNRFM